jgi:aspartyl-tRNA(Asn)/glutamyl-tRNA(Gln) amidotransferase subunit A
MRMAFNILGLPALSIPVGIGSAGLPIAMQLAAAEAGEHSMLGVAGALQRVTSWHRLAPSAS